ncbi:arf-GAP domain and FG repeat-containing protein 1-like isoform X2 [Notothenia coriiceps]|uniref:Arf-GAP domain and FG repeat-containing protein 1-like isoform X2 n=1 Tax=Notothenia coriiceps TaxID=8208 RepID=A0A6I9MY69_9TELE|nr:PREDICTED: arf-GAP domain and FG repeat-containing protein 1-like isoform X2 [Notothenia coriiceps]
MSAAQAQQALPGMAQGFGAQSTNPFVAAPAAPPTNPFQSNGRAAHMTAAAAAAAAGSMSMPAGFGNVAAFNLPTSFSGTFQQPFPGQAPFPQPPAYPQQPNGVCYCVHHVDIDVSVITTTLSFKLARASDIIAPALI